MTVLGTQFMLTYSDCAPDFVNDPDRLVQAVVQAAREAGLTIVREVEHRFEPYGLTLMLLLSQSHLIVHTWPEYDALVVDVFVCTPGFDIQPFAGRLQALSGAGSMKIEQIVFEHQPARQAGERSET